MDINGKTVLDGGNRTTLAHRYEILVRTHRLLEDQITSEAARPIPNSLSMQEMKRRRLRVKEQIVGLEPMLDTGLGGRRVSDLYPDNPSCSAARAR
ncbi:MAG: YdcH family protein [Alphaproteobacteria bacterium]|nr:YdcH family protein [Alphaproteobacteria bacterium]